jgi:hypothetical protein
MNLKSQYEVDINNYKKQLEDKIEAERINIILANQRNENFQKLLDKKEYENQKNLRDMEYEKQMLLEDIELLNECKDNSKDGSDKYNRKLKHKRKHMKFSYDEDNENILYIEKNKNNLDDSYVSPEFSIFANQFIAVGNIEMHIRNIEMHIR